MAKNLDWMYFRKNCNTCKLAKNFLDQHSLTVQTTDDARKDRKTQAQILELARSVGRIVVTKGKKVVTLDLKKDKPDDATLLGYLMGPSGNLRAPALRKGKTLFVGFNEDAYRELAV